MNLILGIALCALYGLLAWMFVWANNNRPDCECDEEQLGT